MGDDETSESPNKRYNTRPKSKTSFEAILNKYDDIESEFAPKPSKRGRPPGTGNAAKNQAMYKSQNYIPQFYQNNMQIYQNNMRSYHPQSNIPNVQYQVATQYHPYNPYKYAQEHMNQQIFNNRMPQPNVGYMYQPNVPQNVPPQTQLMYKSGPYPVSSNIPMQYRPNVSPVMPQVHCETKFIPPNQHHKQPQTHMVQPQPIRGTQLHGPMEQLPKPQQQVPQQAHMINQNFPYGAYSTHKPPIIDKSPSQMSQVDKPTPNSSSMPKQFIQMPLVDKHTQETQQTDKTKLETPQITNPESEAESIRKRMKYTGEMSPVIVNSQTYGYFLTQPKISEEQLQEQGTNGIQNYFNAVDVILKDISKSSMSKNMDSLMPRITITGVYNLTDLDKFVEFNYLLTPNVYKQVLDYFKTLGESNIEFPVLLSTTYRKSLTKSLSSQSFSTQSDSDKSQSESLHNSQASSPNCRTDQFDSSNEKQPQDSHKLNNDSDNPQEGVLDKAESPKIKLQLNSPKNNPQSSTQKTKTDEFQAYFKSNKIKLTRENNVPPITFESLKELTPDEINQFFGFLDKNMCKVIRREGVHKSIIKNVIISNNDLKSHYQVCYSKDVKSSFALKYQFASYFANDFFDKRVPFFTNVDFEHRDPSFLLHSKNGNKKNTNSFIYYAKVSRAFDAFIYKLYAHVTFELSKLVSELDLNATNPTHQLSIRCSLSNVPKILNMIHSNN